MRPPYQRSPPFQIAKIVERLAGELVVVDERVHEPRAREAEEQEREAHVEHALAVEVERAVRGATPRVERGDEERRDDQRPEGKIVIHWSHRIGYMPRALPSPCPRAPDCFASVARCFS